MEMTPEELRRNRINSFLAGWDCARNYETHNSFEMDCAQRDNSLHKYIDEVERLENMSEEESIKELTR